MQMVKAKGYARLNKFSYVCTTIKNSNHDKNNTDNVNHNYFTTIVVFLKMRIENSLVLAHDMSRRFGECFDVLLRRSGVNC